MLLGLGLDVVEVPRFAALVRDAQGAPASRFVEATFTAGELAYCREGALGPVEEHLAVRFAAKEAALKALDAACALVGVTPPTIALVDVEVTRDARGRPRLTWHGRAQTLVDALEVSAAHVSLSHEGAVASAVVALERG